MAVDPVFQKWLCLCLAKLCEDFEEASARAVKKNSHYTISRFLSSPDPEVSASSLAIHEESFIVVRLKFTTSSDFKLSIRHAGPRLRT